MSVICPSCGVTVGEQVGGKLAMGLTAFYFGKKVNPVVALVAGLAGAWLGHQFIDSAVRRCPQCGTIFKIAGGLL